MIHMVTLAVSRLGMRRFLGVLLAASVISHASGQVVINEFSAANYSLNVGGGNEPFVEFYNPTGAAVDLTGYFLSDDPSDPTKFEIPAGVSVPAGGYRNVICSSEGEVPGNLFLGGNLQTNFRVVQTIGESIVFSNPAGVVLESYTFGQDWTPNQADHSWARSVNGAGTWQVCTNPTPAAANGGTMYAGYAPTPVASVQAGHYPAAVSLAWSAPAGYCGH